MSEDLAKPVEARSRLFPSAELLDDIYNTTPEHGQGDPFSRRKAVGQLLPPGRMAANPG